MSTVVESDQVRHHSMAEPPRYQYHSTNRVALEDTDWFNRSINNEDLPVHTPNGREGQAVTRQEDLPPSYEATDLPEYNIDDPSAPPIHTYHLRQIERGLQILVPASREQKTFYRLSTRAGPRLFSKKADITLSRSNAPTDTAVTADKVATSIALRRDNATELVKINFDDSGKLPWMPRASITRLISGGRTHTIPMEARNFRDWTMLFTLEERTRAQNPSTTFIWHLTERPLALELFDLSRPYAIAKFEHTRLGTRATNGAEVGQLLVFKEYELPKGPDLGMVIGSLALVMAHFRRMGRHHYSRGTFSECSSSTTASAGAVLAGYGGRSYSVF